MDWATRGSRSVHSSCRTPASATRQGLAIQPEGVYQRVDDGAGVAVSVPVVKIGHLTAEAQLHVHHDAISIPAGELVHDAEGHGLVVALAELVQLLRAQGGVPAGAYAWPDRVICRRA